MRTLLLLCRLHCLTTLGFDLVLRIPLTYSGSVEVNQPSNRQMVCLLNSMLACLTRYLNSRTSFEGRRPIAKQWTRITQFVRRQSSVTVQGLLFWVCFLHPRFAFLVLEFFFSSKSLDHLLTSSHCSKHPLFNHDLCMLPVLTLMHLIFVGECFFAWLPTCVVLRSCCKWDKSHSHIHFHPDIFLYKLRLVPIRPYHPIPSTPSLRDIVRFSCF